MEIGKDVDLEKIIESLEKDKKVVEKEAMAIKVVCSNQTLTKMVISHGDSIEVEVGKDEHPDWLMVIPVSSNVGNYYDHIADKLLSHIKKGMGLSINSIEIENVEEIVTDDPNDYALIKFNITVVVCNVSDYKYKDYTTKEHNKVITYFWS